MLIAGIVCVLGIVVSIQTILTNHQDTKKINSLQQHGAINGSVPSTTKPSAAAVNQYTVAPDLPRYLIIPKLHVDARVLEVGYTSSGAIGTPNNVFDTAWYSGSSRPGGPGATLIDGHVSSWTTRGVFYNLKDLAAGDSIQVVKGDGNILNYRVVKTQIYNANNVDMQALTSPVVPGVSGLNLITCTGQVEKDTSEFNERAVVFAKEV